ncbi:MAG: hypothetical protein AAFX85_05185 [Pseudomonadota bacterium]
MRIEMKFPLLCGVAALAGLPLVAQSTLLGVTFDGNVFEIDEATAVGTFVGRAGVDELNALELDDQERYLSAADQQVYTVDPATGDATFIAGFDLEGSIRSLAVAQDGTVLAFTGGLRFDAARNAYALDLVTGVATPVALDVPYSVQAATFDPQGTLYAWTTDVSSGAEGGLITIDPATGEFTDVNPQVGDQGLNLQSLAFDPLGGLYGVTTEGTLWLIRPQTGVLITLVGVGPYSDIRGLSWLLPDGVFATFQSIDVRAGVCRNLTVAQTVSLTAPEFDRGVIVDCADLGLVANGGDIVSVWGRGTARTASFRGTVERLVDGANLVCDNLTQGLTVGPVALAGTDWDCAEAGLSIAPGDAVSARITGVAQ